MTMRDCFGYNTRTKKCAVLTETVCEKRKCSFYNECLPKILIGSIRCTTNYLKEFLIGNLWYKTQEEYERDREKYPAAKEICRK